MIDQFASLRTGFRVSRSCGPESLYEISIKFGSLEAMDAADDELRAALAAPAAVQGTGALSNLVPGQMHCARCKFQLTRTNLYVKSGTVGAGGSKTEPCPNGCGPLWPVTWEQAARDAWATCETMFERAKKAEDALEAVAGPRLVATTAATPAPEAAPSAKEGEALEALVAEHARLIEQGNDYAYFELAYTRQTGWMVWITDKPLYGAQPINPDRKVLFKGQGDSPEEACRAALKGLTTAGGDSE